MFKEQCLKLLFGSLCDCFQLPLKVIQPVNKISLFAIDRLPGNFGQVYLGHLTGSTPDQEKLVAVKIIRGNAIFIILEVMFVSHFYQERILV